MSTVQIYAMELSERTLKTLPELIERSLKRKELDPEFDERLMELPCNFISAQLRTRTFSRTASFITARNSQSYLQSSFSKDDVKRMRNYMQDKWREDIAEFCNLIGIDSDEPLWVELDEQSIRPTELDQ